jgi:hypothetical protein
MAQFPTANVQAVKYQVGLCEQDLERAGPFNFVQGTVHFYSSLLPAKKALTMNN